MIDEPNQRGGGPSLFPFGGERGATADGLCRGFLGKGAPKTAWLGMCFLLCMTAGGLAQPSSFPRDDFWVPDGPVNAVVETNGVVYIGGLFDYIGPVSETGTAFDLVSAAPDLSFPRFKGAIKAIVTDNAGGWIVGGLFTAVGGFPIPNLAHILADRTVDTNWVPNPDGAVLALAAGPTTLYAGGTFRNIGGQDRSLLAALELATGGVLPGWRADVTTQFPKASVNTLVLSAGTLYIGGYFSFINNTVDSANAIAREHLGSVDAATGTVTGWFPNGFTGSQSGSRVDALAISENILFVGGTFTSIGGLQTNGPIRNFLAALDTTKNLDECVLPWNPNANGPVTSIAVSCDKVYVGGAFTSIGGANRSRLAALSMASATATDWNPNADNDVLTLQLVGRTLYVGGKFTTIGGQNRASLAGLDVDSGQATLWNPKADTGVAAFALAQGTMLAGGALGPGGKVRKNLAALDARTGKPLDWNPQVSGSSVINNAPYEGVYALAISGNMLYLGGPFTNINGLVRNRLGAVDRFSGAATAWDPSANGIVHALAIGGSAIYAGGTFTSVGGLPRTNLAALNPLSGAATSWRADANARIQSLFFQANQVYVGGIFTRIGGVQRSRLAAIDGATASVAAWNPNVNDQVSSISILGNSAYIGGQFSMVGTQSVSRIAAVDLSSANPTCWRPNAQAPGFPGINAVLASSDGVYAGGTFTTMGGQPRNYLAALSANCPGNATAWDPNMDAPVNTLAASPQMAFAGGAFQNIGGQYHPHLAAFPPEGAPRITLQPQSQKVGVGTNINFTAMAVGQIPLAFQWQFNGTNLAGATTSSLAVPSVQIADSGDYVLVVTNTLGLVQSRPATLTVLAPVVILAQPASQTVSPGATVTLSVVARGSPPPIYQWRLNGVNIPGAIYPILTITNAQPRDGGSYSVVVASLGSAVNSDIASVLVTSTALSLADNLAGRSTITTASGVGSGSNVSATKESGEPNHAGKPGGRSVWLGWIAPANGIATFSTRGSAFDTLLGIYTGTAISNLVVVAADDDRGGFATSEASFNATNGTEYLIAIDGFAGAAGQIVLTWDLDTTTTPFPRILTQPLSQSVFEGNTATFSVVVSSPTPVSYQWFHECRAIPGATDATLTVRSVRRPDVGNYHVELMNASSRPAQSLDASLEIGIAPKVISQDKLEDLFQEVGPGSAGLKVANPSGGFLLVSLGTIDSQVLDNTTATTSLGETNHCGVLGGSSKWLGLHTTAAGVMQVDTIGSAIDTVLAVYTGTSLLNIREVACDNNGAPDGIRSLVRFNAVNATDYLLAVDGVNGAKGTMSLNWKLGLPPTLSCCASNRTVHQGGSTIFYAPTNSPTPDLTYQWLFNGQVMIGATNATLALNNLQAAQAGSYSVIVRNFAGAITNTIANVAVALPIRLEGQIVSSNGASVFRLTGPASQGYVVQSSPSLSCTNCWEPLYTNSTSNAPLDFQDRLADSSAQRFYRVVPWP